MLGNSVTTVTSYDPHTKPERQNKSLYLADVDLNVIACMYITILAGLRLRPDTIMSYCSGLYHSTGKLVLIVSTNRDRDNRGSYCY